MTPPPFLQGQRAGPLFHDKDSSTNLIHPWHLPTVELIDYFGEIWNLRYGWGFLWVFHLLYGSHVSPVQEFPKVFCPSCNDMTSSVRVNSSSPILKTASALRHPKVLLLPHPTFCFHKLRSCCSSAGNFAVHPTLSSSHLSLLWAQPWSGVMGLGLGPYSCCLKIHFRLWWKIKLKLTHY